MYTLAIVVISGALCACVCGQYYVYVSLCVFGCVFAIVCAPLNYVEDVLSGFDSLSGYILYMTAKHKTYKSR